MVSVDNCQFIQFSSFVHNEDYVIALAETVLASDLLRKLVFDSLLETSTVKHIYTLEPLRVRQDVIGWLVSLEGGNTRHRDYAWQQCETLCDGFDILALCNVEEETAAVFFTPEDTLWNTKVIERLVRVCINNT